MDDSFYKASDLAAIEKVDLKRITELTLATIDYGVVAEQEDVGHQKEIACMALINNIKVFSQNHNKYLSFDSVYEKQKSIILYASYNEVYRPDCAKHEKFYFKTVETCYEDLKIMIERNSHNITAYLTTQGIVVAYSKPITCNSNTIRAFRLPNSTFALVQKGSQTKLVDINSYLLEQVRFTDNTIDRSVEHDSILQEQFDLENTTLKELDRTTDFQKIYVKLTKLNTNNIAFHLDDIQDFFDHAAIIIIAAVLSLIIIVTCCSCCCQNLVSCCCKSLRQLAKMLVNCFAGLKSFFTSRYSSVQNTETAYESPPGYDSTGPDTTLDVVIHEPTAPAQTSDSQSFELNPIVMSNEIKGRSLDNRSSTNENVVALKALNVDDFLRN